jgi:hypothetical protein
MHGAPSPTPSLTPSAAPVVVEPAAQPKATPTHRPTATPSASPSALPSAVETTLVTEPPQPAATIDPPPRIVDVSLSERTVHSGDRVVGRIQTSLNTASVEARIGGYSLNLTKVGAGRFAVNYTVPWIPFFMHGKYDMTVIARNTEGIQTRRIVPITVQ